MQTKITAVQQRGIGIVWAIQLPHAVIFTPEGTLDAAQKKLEEIKKS